MFGHIQQDKTQPVLDQTSLLIAIGLSAIALMLTVVITWAGTPKDRYLLSWGLGLGFVAPGAVLYGWFDDYNPLVAFSLLLAGFAFIYLGSAQFSLGRTPWRPALMGWAVSVLLMAALFAAGLSGAATIVLNLAAGLYFLAAGRAHWIARAQMPFAMLAKSVIYGVTSISFMLCGIVLAMGGQWVLTARPQNWAEDFNSVAMVASLAAAGAVAMALHQHRVTETHRRLALTDSLTGLLNRRALFNMAGTAPLPLGSCVIMLDLDDFKTINDRFGHAVGDEILTRFSAILSASLRPGDIAARIGGEEFCLLLHDIDAAAAHTMAERIRHKLEATDPLPDGYGPPTVSAGLAMASPGARTFDELIRAADELLYRAKDAGRNRVLGPERRLAA